MIRGVVKYNPKNVLSNFERKRLKSLGEATFFPEGFFETAKRATETLWQLFEKKILVRFVPRLSFSVFYSKMSFFPDCILPR